jgi:hypothetical protein
MLAYASNYLLEHAQNSLFGSFTLLAKALKLRCDIHVNSLHDCHHLILFSVVDFTLDQSSRLLDGGEGVFFEFFALFLKLIQKFLMLLCEEINFL